MIIFMIEKILGDRMELMELLQNLRTSCDFTLRQHHRLKTVGETGVHWSEVDHTSKFPMSFYLTGLNLKSL